MDCQSEEQPAEIGEPDKAQNDADDENGGALRANRRLRLLHHHGAGFRIPDLCRLWNPCSEGACSRAKAIAVRAGSVYAREKHVQPSRNAVFAAVRACRCAEIRWEWRRLCAAEFPDRDAELPGLVSEIRGDAGAGEDDDADRQHVEDLIVAFERCSFVVAGPVGRESGQWNLAVVGPAGGDALGASGRPAVEKHHVVVLGVNLVSATGGRELLSRRPDPSRSWRRPLPLEGGAEEPRQES